VITHPPLEKLLAGVKLFHSDAESMGSLFLFLCLYFSISLLAWLVDLKATGEM
jgi:hypothetical protein